MKFLRFLVICFMGFVCLIIFLVVGAELFGHFDPSAPSTTPGLHVAPWDGSVLEVKWWLKDHLRDPDSLVIEGWSKVVSTSKGYEVRCLYRSKNGFGGYVRTSQVFTLDTSGQVIDYSP